MTIDLFKPGNVWLADYLSHFQKQARRRPVYTNRLLKEELNSTHYGQSTLLKARDLGLIDRVEGEPPGPGQLPPVYNKNHKGRRL